ncbi:Uncharacterised protein [Mycolicibacterium phlei]|uniref:hypothetical protein n=1 Tax=Mycobacteroides chelonae TaxID=1774 RepID=UPI000618CFB8|nr:hypothetical protein [Mycobacteroides chelonae]VEG15252.1 Uncharacterised protein [Mycolicibacterium phlei]AKC38061.1 membrane protein [Mycobacteroides chelonae]ANA97259.1 membrane protein [Mycobacteroides chelonae CCUG 47445]OLT75598.1 hypothetical protein BKG56_18100 [Mycobacteroides chelonae]ORV13256.1 hypothetical protein AWB96_18340 [Mycobacteroides chelonae]
MSRTAIIIIVGVIAALAFLAVGALVKQVGIQAAVTHFLVAWASVAVFNMGVGVFEAGYGVAEELPVLLAVFGVPAAVAGLGWLGARRLARS